MMNIMKIINEIKFANKIAIMSHIFPDGDAVGSCLALASALRENNRIVDVFLQDGVPEIYSFLPGANYVNTDINDTKYDLAIALDSGDLERLGTAAAIFNTAKVRINIDHHQTNTYFGDYNHVETIASSVGEIIYRIIKMSDIDINKDTADCLYVAIATDTGGFRFSNTTSTCMQVAADLINHGVDVSDISRRIFDIISLPKVRLIGAAIDSLELFSDGKIAVMCVSNQKREELNAKFEDFDGIVNFARNIPGVEAAVLLNEKKQNEIKINLRSNSFIDVSVIADKYAGGGHKRAAGCTISGESIGSAKTKIVQELVNALKNVYPN